MSYGLDYTSEETAFLVPLSPVVHNCKWYVDCSDHLMLSSHVAAFSWRSFFRETQVSWDNLLFECNSSLVEKKRAVVLGRCAVLAILWVVLMPDRSICEGAREEEVDLLCNKVCF